MSNNTNPIITQSNTSAQTLKSLGSEDSKKVGKCNTKLWIIVSAIAALIIAAIIIVIVIVSNNGDGRESKVTTESTDQPTTSTDEPTTPVTNKPTTPETNEPTTPETNKPTTPETNEPTTQPSTQPIIPLQSEFEFNTQSGDFKEVSLVQISNDQSIFNSQTVSTKVKR